MLTLDYAQLSDPGSQREHNEDALGVFVPSSPSQTRSHGFLFVLADGVGGHSHGEVASNLAVRRLLEDFADSPSAELPAPLLQRLAIAANTAIFEQGLKMPLQGAPMATTLVTCLLRYDRATIAHVGDSRCYLLRDGRLKLLTRDHTVAADQVRLGLLSVLESAQAATATMLSRSLGSELMVNVDVNEIQVYPGDLLLLCTDGFYASLREQDFLEALSLQGHYTAPALERAARQLVAVANRRDGSDNISVQLIAVRSVEHIGMYRGRPYALRTREGA